MALRFSFLAISRLIFIALLNCIVSDALLRVSVLTTSVRFVTMSVGLCGQGKVLEGPSNILHRILQMEAGVPACDLGFFYKVVVFLRKHLLEDGPSLVCQPLFAPFLEC